MTRNLKALGVILAAAFALCAAFASAAQAEPVLTAAKYPVTLTGDQVEHNSFPYNTYTLGAKKLYCKHVTFHATVKETEKSSITVTPSYTECFANPGEIPLTVNMTGCDYKFHGGEEDVAGHVKNATVDLVCPVGVTGVDITAYQNAAEHAANKPLCSYVATPFTNHGGVTYTNTPETSGAGIPNDFDITLNEVESPVEKISGSVVLCGAVNQTAKYDGEITVTGFYDPNLNEPEKERIGVTVSTPK